MRMYKGHQTLLIFIPGARLGKQHYMGWEIRRKGCVYWGVSFKSEGWEVG